ncbi:MAG: HAMP domain-containing protein, partial [Ignavibacteriales bacterium]|nr:HAMP domain-containing protein [Ignavibacteriales bacterium]
MKISLRIILINFLTLILILFGSGIAFYTVVYNIITTQETKHLLNTANDFIFNLESNIELCDSSFMTYLHKPKSDPEIEKLDFIVKADAGRFGRPRLLMAKSNISIPIGDFSLQDCFVSNPYLLVRLYKNPAGVEYVYGFNLQKEFFTEIAAKLRIDIAVYIDNEMIALSNDIVNQGHYYFLNKAFASLNFKNNFDVFSGNSGESYLIATTYRAKEIISNNRHLSILIFGTTGEVENLRQTTTNILVLLFIVSIILTFILTYVFSGRIRKQVDSLNQAVQIVKKGDFTTRIPVTTNDELGALASAFNAMLTELQEQEKLKSGYTDLIALINQNASYQALLPAILEKIVKSTGSVFGGLYLVSSGTIVPAAAYGFEPDTMNNPVRFDALLKVLDSKEMVHYKFEKDAPQILAGMVSIKVAEMILVPIFGNENAIAVLQLGSVGVMGESMMEYLEKIKGQLAIGLAKALAHKQLEEIISELELQKKKAEESTELKSKFLATVSHELRTPLNSIMGLTELMANDKANSVKTKERLLVILKSSKRLLKMINEVLHLSRIEAGKMEVEIKDFYVHEFLSEIFSSFNPLAEKKGLAFSIHARETTQVILRTDREKLLHVIGNLIGHAVKFTSEGSVEIFFTVENSRDCSFSVKDTGIGISEGEATGIFDEFHQVDNSSTRNYGGSGLGLSIAKKFIELLKGSITLESVPGKGSNFTVKIPGVVVQNNESSGSDAV